MSLIGAEFHRSKVHIMLPQCDRAALIVDGSGSSAFGLSGQVAAADLVQLGKSLDHDGVPVLQVVQTASGPEDTPRTYTESSASATVKSVLGDLEGGPCYLSPAIRTAASALGGVPGLIILYTDGVFYDKREHVQTAVDEATSKGAQIVALGPMDSPGLGNIPGIETYYRMCGPISS